MKKLIMAVAIIGAAVVSQAATCSWGSGVITMQGGATAGKGSITAYVFEIGSSTYGDWSVLSATALSDAVWNEYGDSLADADGNKSSTLQGKADVSAIAINANETKYAAILYVDNNGGTKPAYYMGNVASISWSGTGGAQASNLASFITGGTSGTPTAWQAVPEPTSGLLLLLGMAGLALKRKRA